MEHIKAFESDDILKDMRSLDLSPRRHGILLCLTSSDDNAVNAFAYFATGKNFKSMAINLWETIGVSEYAEYEYKGEDYAKMVEILINKMLGGGDSTIEYIGWKLTPREGLDDLSAMQVLTNPVKVYSLGKRYFVDFESELNLTEYGNI
jgi:hypothetical protein